MTDPEPDGSQPSRRAFLTAFGAAVGAAALGGFAWGLERLLNPDSPPVSTTTTQAVALSTLPPLSTTTTSSTTTTISTTTTTAPPMRQVQVICRDAWGAVPPTGDFTLHTIERITVHHTGAVIEDNTLAPYFTRRHQLYHQGDELGWPDIAYHFLIDFNGHVYEGRRWDAVGDTRTSYDPTGHLLIAAKGNFEEQTPTEAQLDTLRAMLAWGCEAFSIDPADITGHRDWAATACPGAALYERVSDGTLADEVNGLINEMSTELSYFCGPEATALVAAIEAGAA